MMPVLFLLNKLYQEVAHNEVSGKETKYGIDLGI